MIMLRSVCAKCGNDMDVKNVSLTAREGKVTVLLGPSGSGKSAICDIICGVTTAMSGNVLIDGCDIEKDPIEAKRRIGYMPQDPAVFRDMTIRGQLRFIGQAREVSARALGEQVEKIIKQTKLEEVANTPIRLLPEAYLQRVGIAQALMGDIPNIVLDAPSKPLDAKQTLELRAIIKEACAGRTMLVASDNLTEAAALGDDVYVLYKGAIAGHTTMDRLIEMEADFGETLVEIASEKEKAVSSIKETGMPAEVVDERDGIVTIKVETGTGIEGKKAVSVALAKAGLPVVGMRPARTDIGKIILQLANEPFAAEGAEAE